MCRFGIDMPAVVSEKSVRVLCEDVSYLYKLLCLTPSAQAGIVGGPWYRGFGVQRACAELIRSIKAAPVGPSRRYNLYGVLVCLVPYRLSLSANISLDLALTRPHSSGARTSSVVLPGIRVPRNVALGGDSGRLGPTHHAGA